MSLISISFQGIPNSLWEPYSVVLTESMARKYFGESSLINKELEIAPLDQTFYEKYIVKGIIEEDKKILNSKMK